MSAVALRNYGLALATGLIPVIALLVKSVLPGVIQTFLFNFGVVIALAALMLTYLNYAPEPVTISAKLVGISLVTTLLVLGFAGIWVFQTIPGLPEHHVTLIFITLVLISSLLILFAFPYFFRATLIGPLDKLLQGVRAANDGDLDVQVEVQYDDEIGFLTRSFNQMLSSTKELTAKLENRSLLLETEVNQRTEELTRTNVALQKENAERENAEIALNQQIMYQQALAGCSQALLVPADNKDDQQNVLNQALEHLRSGAEVSRAYIFRLFQDTDLGLCMEMLAEVCAPGIKAYIQYPINLKFPLSRLPIEFTDVLAKGKPYGGLVRHVFASTPDLQENFSSQKPPLLSVMFFPLFMRKKPWGFVGFDDCVSERDWDEREISILRTASEMIENTLQRWRTAAQLQETLDHLELRVIERTADLRVEIQERQRAQDELAVRLKTEEKLAIISSKLLEPSNIKKKIAATLEYLLEVMNAERVFLVEFDLETQYQTKVYMERHTSEIPSISLNVIPQITEVLGSFETRLRAGETILIEDTAQALLDIDLRILLSLNVKSMVLVPLIIEKKIYGVLGCSNPRVPSDTETLDLQILELVASMLKSLMQREHLIQTLEEQVAERTRQLTTFLDMAMLSDQSQDLADILQPTLRSISQIVDFDALGIHIIDEKITSLTLIAQMGIPPDLLELLRKIELDDELVAWLESADSSQPVYQPDHDAVFPELFCLPDYQSYYSIHLRVGSKTLGIMNCYRMANQPFSPFQTMLLTALGDLLSIIIENHNLRVEGQELAAIEERQRLARDIHDAVSQSVYSLSLFARSANDALDDGDREKLTANLDDIETTALQSMREMRLLLYQLQDTRLEDDFASALENRFRQVEKRLGVQATFAIDDEIRLPIFTQHEVWRIILEALNNTVKHAHAGHVHVQVSCNEEYLRISIEDDGIGFDTGNYPPGMGLKNMRTRIESLDGSLEITSNPGQGTKTLLIVPLVLLDSDEGERH